MKLTYGSFATDAGFRGALILAGDLDAGAFAIVAHMKGLNPGGQVLALPVDTDEEDMPPDLRAAFLNERNHNRLLTKVEAIQLFDGVRLSSMNSDGAEMN